MEDSKMTLKEFERVVKFNGGREAYQIWRERIGEVVGMNRPVCAELLKWAEGLKDQITKEIEEEYYIS